MKYILDTHIFIWSLVKPDKLSPNVKKIISTSPFIYVSTVALWEISVKYGLGKLQLEGITPEELWLQANAIGYKSLTFSPEEALSFHHLENLHKDAFDRMIIWQAVKNNMVLISMDDSMKLYLKYGLQLMR